VAKTRIAAQTLAPQGISREDGPKREVPIMTDDIKAESETKSRSKRGKRAAAAKDRDKTAGKAVWMGTAVGIGSAAIVAALLYAKRRDSDR
jgi:hypothetical protein